MPVIAPLAGSTSAPQQHKQPSRKGRKAWRKHVDVSEVEQGLEERNNQIIKGGLINEKASDDLFQIHDEGDLAVAKQLASKYKKGLKADEILAQRSAVPAVSGRKRSGGGNISSSSSKTTDGVLAAKRQRTGYVTHKELVRLKRVADGHHEATISVADATYDPWAETASAAVPAPPKPVRGHVTTVVPPAAAGAAGAVDEEGDSSNPFSFLPTAQPIRAPATLKKAPVSLAANGKPVPAVAKPGGDASYNPSFSEYEARLAAEGDKAVEAERKRLAAEEAERVRQEAVARSAAEAEEAEARAALSEWDEDSAWEGFQSGAEGGGGPQESDLAAKQPKRKTPAQRNRIQRRKAAEAQARHEAQERRKREQAANLERLLAEDAFAREQQALVAVGGSGGSDDEDQGPDAAAGDDSVLRRRRLGAFRLPDKDLELVLPDELEDSLRRLKPEGNLLKDRYRSLLVRGKVEARRKRPFRKQAKAKITEKWAHKDFHLF